MKKRLALVIGTSVGIISAGTFAMSQATAGQMDVLAQTGESMMQPSQPQFANTEWVLEDLNGTGVVDNLQTTLRFEGRDRLSGQGVCNRYTAQAQLVGKRLTVGGIASTKKLCPPAVMDQENRYFQVLQSAQRVNLDGAYLLVYSQGVKAPLRFTRLTAANLTETTLVAFQGRRNAVRVFTRDGQMQMNVYDKRDRTT